MHHKNACLYSLQCMVGEILWSPPGYLWHFQWRQAKLLPRFLSKLPRFPCSAFLPSQACQEILVREFYQLRQRRTNFCGHQRQTPEFHQGWHCTRLPLSKGSTGREGEGWDWFWKIKWSWLAGWGPVDTEGRRVEQARVNRTLKGRSFPFDVYGLTLLTFT